MDKAIGRLGIGLHMAVESGEPANDKFLLEGDRLFAYATGVIGDRRCCIIGPEVSHEAIDVAFGDDRRFCGILLGGLDMGRWH